MRYILTSVEDGTKQEVDIPSDMIRKIKGKSIKKKSSKSRKTLKKIQSSKPMMIYKSNKKHTTK